MKKFPIVVKNNLETWQTIGKIWLPPLGCLSVSEMLYRQNEERFKFALESRRVSVLDDKCKCEDVECAESDATFTDAGLIGPCVTQQGEESIIKEYVEGNLHWRTAKKLIDEVDDIEKLDGLLVEARHYGLQEDSAIYKSLDKRLEELVDAL